MGWRENSTLLDEEQPLWKKGSTPLDTSMSIPSEEVSPWQRNSTLLDGEPIEVHDSPSISEFIRAQGKEARKVSNSRVQLGIASAKDAFSKQYPGVEWNEEIEAEYDTWKRAYSAAEKSAQIGSNPAWHKLLAEAVPEKERQKVLDATREIVSERRTSGETIGSKGFLKRAGYNLLSGVADVWDDVGNITGQGLTKDQQVFQSQLQAAHEEADPIRKPGSSPLNIGEGAVSLARMAPPIYMAAQGGELAGKGAKILGAGKKVATAAGSLGAASTFAPGIHKHAYTTAKRAGLSDEKADEAANWSTVLQTALFSATGMPAGLISKIGGKKVVAKTITDSIVKNYGLPVAGGIATMTGAAAIDSTVRELSKKSEGKGFDLGQIASDAWETIKNVELPVAALAAGRGIKGIGATLESNRSQIYKKDIIKAAQSGGTPSKGTMLKWGIEPASNRAESRARIKAKAEELKAAEKTPVEQKSIEETPVEQKSIEETPQSVKELPSQEVGRPVPIESAMQTKVEGPAKPPELVGIANELTNELRLKRGEEPLETKDKKPWSELLSEAGNEIAKDKTAPERLVADLETNPRPHTDKEVAILSYHKRELENTLAEKTNIILEAQKSGRPADVVKAQIDANDVLNKIRDVELVSRSAGTESARGLNVRKILLTEDFTPAKLLSRAFIKKGEPLTTEETAKITEMGQRIQELEAQLKSNEIGPKKSFVKTSARRERAKKEVDEAWAEFNAAISGKPKESIVTGESGALNVDVAKASLRLAKAYAKQGIATVGDFLENAKGILGEKFDKYKDHLAEAWNTYTKGTMKERIARTSNSLDRAIERLENDLKEGKIEYKEKKEPISTPEIDAKRERLKELKVEREKLREESGLAKERKDTQYNKILEDRLETIQGKIASGKFGKLEKPPRELTKYQTDLKFKIEQQKMKLNSMEREWERQQRSTLQKTLSLIPESLNFSRTLLTSMDLSAVLRQGGFFALGHPVKAAKIFPDMLKAFVSRKGEFASAEEIRNRPNAQLYKRDKLSLTVTEGGLSAKEEEYMGNWARYIPLVAGSERAYVTFLNRMRADMYDMFSATLSRTGKPTRAEGAVIADFVNMATGRGNMGRFQAASEALATTFFAPRYVVSRFQLALGKPLLKGTSRTRSLIAKEYARTLTGLGVFYVAIKAAFGDEVWYEFDPRSSDFGKVIFKDGRRLDPLMGLSQTTVISSRLGIGLLNSLGISDIGAIKKPTGETVKLGEGWNASKASDLIARFLRGKLSPWLGTAIDITEGQNIVGEETTPKSVARSTLAPLSFRDIYEAMTGKGGIPRKTALSLLVILGMGAQNYQNARPGMFARKIAEHPRLKGFNKKTRKEYDYSTTVNQVIRQSIKSGVSYEDMAQELTEQLRKEGVSPETRAEWLRRLRERLNRNK